MNTNRINNSSESGDTDAGGAEMLLLFLCEDRTAGGKGGGTMAKFLNYEDRLEIQNGLKDHLTFTKIAKSWEGAVHLVRPDCL